MTELRQTFPILSLYRMDDLIRDAHKAGLVYLVIGIPWQLIAPHEKQAGANHGQTLKGLAARGGLSACEALAVLEDRPWHRMGFAEAHSQLAATLRALETQGPENSR